MFLQSLLSYINSKPYDKNSNLEFEIKVILDSRIKTPSFVPKFDNQRDLFKTIQNIVSNALQYGTPKLSQTINFIHTYSAREDGMFVKQLFFENGIQDKTKKHYYTKKSLANPVYLISDDSQQPPYKLSINIETEQLYDINQFDIVRFRLRYSICFQTKELQDWTLDLTLVKETRNLSLEQLKNTRDEMFATNLTSENFMEKINWEIADRIELELEYNNISNPIQLKHISQLDKLWQILQSKEKSYIDCVCHIAQIIKPNHLSKFKSGYFGLKQLGSNPVELTKKSYNKDVLSNISNFILTEKVDGIRTMLMIYPQKGECHIINKTYRYIDIPKSDIKEDLIILDTEEYIHNEQKYYYVFDVIWFGKNVSYLPFVQSTDEDRMSYIEKVVELYDFLKSKHFIYLTQEDYSDQITDFHDLVSTLPYETDGFIFISKNLDYNHTLNSKWKPIKKMTIDCVAKKCPSFLLGINPYVNKENQTLYLLFVGVRSDEYHKLGIKKLKNYEKIFKKVHYKDQYFPIQFSPSSEPYAYLFWSENSELDGRVVELTRINNEWKLFKIRDDRKIDMDRKTYYGNYFKFAEYIWMNYSNPLTITNLTEPVKRGYFQEDDNKQYTHIRKFNNFVKNKLIQLYTSNIEINWVIDLASGKGQDLFKYIDCNIKNILMIDNDQLALTEVINRKYSYIDNKSIRNLSKIFIKLLDLSDSYKKNLLAIQESNFGIPSSGVPLVVCNFALHYLIPNKRKIQNFVNLLNKLLCPGGIFIFTAFNGSKISELLENGDWEKRVNNNLLYSIKKKYTGSEFTGINQKIDVLLPFSNGQYYTEYLINIDLLNEELEKKKITLVSEDTFNIYLNQFKQAKPYFHRSLTNNDKEFISLYNFYVYHKPNKARR